MAETMMFPATFDEFAEQYGFKDKQEVYTNGSELIQVFRVRQWLDHIGATETNDGCKSEWISVEERLPDGNGRFLTVDKKGDMMVCYWEKRFGWFASVCNKNAITHWMPLPEPPKGE